MLGRHRRRRASIEPTLFRVCWDVPGFIFSAFAARGQNPKWPSMQRNVP